MKRKHCYFQKYNSLLPKKKIAFFAKACYKIVLINNRWDVKNYLSFNFIFHMSSLQMSILTVVHMFCQVWLLTCYFYFSNKSGNFCFCLESLFLHCYLCKEAPDTQKLWFYDVTLIRLHFAIILRSFSLKLILAYLHPSKKKLFPS